MTSGLAVLLVPLLLAQVPAAPLKDRSVVVLPLVNKGGLAQGVVDLLTEAEVASVRRTQRFGRVVSAGELVDTINFETQRQLVDCSTNSCMVEIAGALGVDYICGGSLGQVGTAWMLNLRLVNRNTGVGEASVTRLVEGTETDVAKAVDSVVAELLAQVPNPDATARPPAAHTQGPASAEATQDPRNVHVRLGRGGVSFSPDGKRWEDDDDETEYDDPLDDLGGMHVKDAVLRVPANLLLCASAPLAGVAVGLLAASVGYLTLAGGVEQSTDESKFRGAGALLGVGAVVTGAAASAGLLLAAMVRVAGILRDVRLAEQATRWMNTKVKVLAWLRPLPLWLAPAVGALGLASGLAGVTMMLGSVAAPKVASADAWKSGDPKFTYRPDEVLVLAGLVSLAAGVVLTLAGAMGTVTSVGVDAAYFHGQLDRENAGPDAPKPVPQPKVHVEIPAPPPFPAFPPAPPPPPPPPPGTGPTE